MTRKPFHVKQSAIKDQDITRRPQASTGQAGALRGTLGRPGGKRKPLGGNQGPRTLYKKSKEPRDPRKPRDDPWPRRDDGCFGQNGILGAKGKKDASGKTPILGAKGKKDASGKNELLGQKHDDKCFPECPQLKAGCPAARKPARKFFPGGGVGPEKMKPRRRTARRKSSQGEE